MPTVTFHFNFIKQKDFLRIWNTWSKNIETYCKFYRWYDDYLIKVLDVYYDTFRSKI